MIPDIHSIPINLHDND